MSELKSRIAYINGLSKRVGPEIEPAYGNNERITYTWNSFITQEKADEMVVELQARINAAQDAVMHIMLRQIFKFKSACGSETG